MCYHVFQCLLKTMNNKLYKYLTGKRSLALNKAIQLIMEF